MIPMYCGRTTGEITRMISLVVVAVRAAGGRCCGWLSIRLLWEELFFD